MFYFILSIFFFPHVLGDDNPVKVMNDVIAKYKNYTAKWNGIMGNDHLPRLVIGLSLRAITVSLFQQFGQLDHLSFHVQSVAIGLLLSHSVSL